MDLAHKHPDPRAACSVPYAAVRDACAALLPPSAPGDVRAWGAGVLAALTALARGSQARFVLRLDGRDYAWGDGPPAASGRARRDVDDTRVVGVSVAAPEHAGAAAFTCAVLQNPNRTRDRARVANASALLDSVRPALACAVALRVRGEGWPTVDAPPPGHDPDAAPEAFAPSTPRAADLLLRDRFALTDRELDVVRLLLTGHRNAEIARALGISPHTARHHTEHVLVKLAVPSRAAVAGLAARLVAEPPPAGGQLPRGAEEARRIP